MSAAVIDGVGQDGHAERDGGIAQVNVIDLQKVCAGIAAHRL